MVRPRPSTGFTRRRFMQFGATGAGAVAAGVATGHLPPVGAITPAASPTRAVLAAAPVVAALPSVTVVPGAVSAVLLPNDFAPLCAGPPASAPAVIFQQFNQNQVGVYTSPAAPAAYLVASLGVPYGATLKQVDAFFVVPGTTAVSCSCYVEIDQVAGAATMGTTATVTGTGFLQATAAAVSIKAFSRLYQPAVWVPTASDHWLCGVVYQYLPLDMGFTPITPVRVYDSRFNNPVQPLGHGDARVVSVATGYTPNTNTVITTNAVPAGTTAIAYNLTIANTSGGGFLYVGPGDDTAIRASSINWSSAGAVVANGLTVKVDSSRRVKVFCYGGTADVIIDVMGYWGLPA